MADFTFTAANVKLTATSTVYDGVAGEAITAGQAVYLDSNDGRVWLAKASGSKAQAACVGLCVSEAAAAGQPCKYATGIIEDTGAGFTEGLVYVLSGTAGALSPHTDATTPASTEFATVVGVAETSSLLHVYPIASGGQVA